MTSQQNVEETKEKASFINLAVIENSDGEVLLIRRVNKETGKDGSTLEWAFPGGKLRTDETRETCVEREVLDETGYKIKAVRQLNIRMHPQMPVCVVYHLCQLETEEQTKEPSEPHEVAEIRWVKPTEVKSLFTTNLDPSVAKALRIE